MDLLSVVVCTYNRSTSLARTLESLAAQRTNGTFTFEVIVVDNKSRDDTRAVVESFMPRFDPSTRPADSGARSGFRPADRSAGLHMRLAYAFEGRQGLSHARNTGVARAQGAVVAFTDDDVRPQPAWLAALCEAFTRFRADCVYGKVLPEWEAERPGWLSDYFLGRLALLDRGAEPFLVTDERQEFYGANFAVTRAALAATGAFNPALGRTGEQLGGGEDVDYFARLFRAGRRIAYAPAAVVHHRVPRERMTPGYFRRWHFQHGESSAHAERAAGRALFGIPLWTLRDFAGHLGGWVAAGLTRRTARRLEHEMKLMFYLGLFSRTLRTTGRAS